MKGVLFALLLVLISSCNFTGRQEPPLASITLTMRPNNQVKTAILDPRISCIRIKVYKEDGSFAKEVAAAKGVSTISVSGIPPGNVIIDLLMTDGIPIGGKCSGNKIDQINTTATIVAGQNSLVLSFPRANWVIQGGPITLNLTDPTSADSLSGFLIHPHRAMALNNGYINNSIIFYGNLPQCDPVLGTYCGARTEINSVFTAPNTTDVILGNEFSGYPVLELGWVPLTPSGANPRYLGVVSKPPCSYKNPPNMISCSYTMNPDLTPNMGLRFVDGSTLQGYLWEVLVTSASETITCYSDKSLTNQITCPPEISSFPYQFEAQSFGSVTNRRIRTQQLVTGVQTTVNKVFEEFSFSLGSFVYVMISRSMNFDVGLHNITALGENLLNTTNFSLFYMQGASPSANVVPVDLTGNRLTPLGANDIGYPFLVPHFLFSDLANLQYTGFNPLYLVFVQGGALFKVPANNPSAPPQQLSTFSSLNICYVHVSHNPISAVVHIFVRELGPDGLCFTPDDPMTYINSNMLPTDNPLPVPYFRDVAGIFMSGKVVTNFLLFDDSTGNILSCDTTFTTCPTLVTITSFLRLLGYSFKAQRTFFVADGSLYSFDGSTAQPVLNPVDTCSFTENVIYCAFTDPTTLETTIYSYDPFKSTSTTLTTLSVPGMTDEIIPLYTYALLRYIRQDGSYGYIAIHAQTGNTTTVNFPTGRNPFLSYSTGKTAIGIDEASGTFQELCYVRESNIGTGTCLSGSFKPSNIIYTNSGPIQDPLLFGFYNEGQDKFYVVLDCVRSGFNCTGGIINEFNTDVIGSRPLFNVPAGEQVGEILKIGTALLVFTEDPSITPPSNRKVYFIDSISGTSQVLESVLGEFYPVTTYP